VSEVAEPSPIAVLGAWHLGAVAAATLAGWGREVRIWDRDAEVRAGLAAGRAAVREPGLDEALASDRLEVGERPEEVLRGCPVVLVAYDTPVDDLDRPDLTPVLEAVDLAAAHADRGALVLVHSQVPVGTGRALERRLADAGRSDLLLAETPENLRLGAAMRGFAEPGFLVVGSASPAAAEAALRFWAPTGAELSVTDLGTAELAKHVINGLLATCVAFGNEAAEIAGREGADALAAARLARRDPRLAALPILPGPPFGGGTLARDLGVLADLGGPDSLPASVRRANDRRLDSLAARVGADAAGGGVALLGLAYKVGTSTLRRSPSLALAASLLGRGIPVRAWDPQVDAADPALAAMPGLSLADSLEDAVAEARVVVVMLSHPAFAALAEIDLPAVGVACVHDLAGLLPDGAPPGVRLRGP
jgi:UDPglucose 6-dehydrogenase